MHVSRIVLGLAFLLAANLAQAATYTVASNADAGAGTLRQAITDAQASPDAASTITFSAGLDGTTITLIGFSNDTSGGSKEFGASAFFINQTKTITIDAAIGMVHGVTLARDTVAADYPGSPATAPNFRLFDVGVGSTLTLRGLKLSNGVAQGGGSGFGGGALGAGGSIFNQGTLIAERCTFADNQASGGATGFATDGDGNGGGGVGAKSNPDNSGGGPNGGASAASGGFGGGGGGAGAGGFGGGGGRRRRRRFRRWRWWRRRQRRFRRWWQ